jgi:hypothetical protein
MPFIVCLLQTYTHELIETNSFCGFVCLNKLIRNNCGNLFLTRPLLRHLNYEKTISI